MWKLSDGVRSCTLTDGYQPLQQTWDTLLYFSNIDAS
jgi:hypothetical protein